jgi:hypothetical protein
MSWDQSYYIEPVNHFLARLVGIDVAKLVAEETARRMAEQGIEVVTVEDMGRVDDMYGPDDPLMRVTLSDGRTFVHKNTHREWGDDWGSDDWELRPEDEETVTEKKYHNPDGPEEESNSL